MIVSFNDVVVLDVFKGTSKDGKPYGRLKFLVDSCEVFEVFVSEKHLPALSELERKMHVKTISFDLQPAFNGGVRLVPAW